MRSWIIILAFTGITLSSFADQQEKMYRETCVLDSSKIDESLENNQSIYVFTFHGIIDRRSQRSIHYSIDKKEAKEILIEGRKLIITTTPGKHIFQFFYESDYLEVYSDSLLIEAQHRAHWSVYMQSSLIQEVSEKPIIYLYPQEPTAVEMTLKIKGDDPFLYPTYADGWRFTAHPNGDLTFGENTYNYLFWEASNVEPFRSEDAKTGFVIPGEKSTVFLEEKLTEAGLTAKERADFITYWAPRMSKNEHNLIHFIFNEECERYATLCISPKPNNIYRIYMVWTSIYGGYEVEEQKIQAVNRNGFTVLEWGGQESYFRRNVCRIPK